MYPVVFYHNDQNEDKQNFIAFLSFKQLAYRYIKSDMDKRFKKDSISADDTFMVDSPHRSPYRQNISLLFMRILPVTYKDLI